MEEHEADRGIAKADGSYYQYVDKYTVHSCEEFQALNMQDVEIWIWKSTGQAQIIISLRSCPITFCPFCREKLSKDKS